MKGFVPRLAAILVALALGAASAAAVEPDEILEDPALEARARELSQELRCLVCQNESIDSSSSGLARDLRIIVRERLVAGDSDAEVKSYLVARYGDFVLLKPPVKPTTYLLWYGPAVILLMGAAGVAVFFRRRRGTAPAAAGPAPLNAEERSRLDKLLTESDPSSPPRV